MSRSIPFDLRRALLFIAAATGLAIIIGVFQQGSMAGGLLLGLAVGVGITVALVLIEISGRYLNT